MTLQLEIEISPELQRFGELLREINITKGNQRRDSNNQISDVVYINLLADVNNFEMNIFHVSSTYGSNLKRMVGYAGMISFLRDHLQVLYLNIKGESRR